MKYSVSVVKRITLLIMTMALAVAIVACTGATSVKGETGATGAQGEPGPAGPAGESSNESPMQVKDLPTLYVALAGSGITPDKMAKAITLGDHFKDAETPTLEYKVKSVDPADVATVKIADGKTATEGKKAGTAMVTIEVYDGVNDPIEGTFSVMVVASNVEPVVERPAAAVDNGLSVGADSDVQKLGKKIYVSHGASTVTVSSVIYDFGGTEGSAGDDPLTFEAAVGNAGGDDDIASVSVAMGSKPDTWDVTLTPKKAGHQNVVVTVMDKFGASADVKWRFTVFVNTKPTVAVPLPTRTVTSGTGDDATETIAIATYFTTVEKAPTQPQVTLADGMMIFATSHGTTPTTPPAAGTTESAHADFIPDTDAEGDLAADNPDRQSDTTCSYSTTPDQTTTGADAQMGSGTIAITQADDNTDGTGSLPIPDGKVGQYTLTIACRDGELDPPAVSEAIITVLQG